MDEMMDIENNMDSINLYHFGDITPESILPIVEQIHYTDVICKQRYDESLVNSDIEFVQPIINLYINSCGGDVYSAIGLIDVIRHSKCCICTIAVGFAASSACLVLASGHRRYAYRNCVLMIHQMGVDTVGSLPHVNATVSHLNEFQKKIQHILDDTTSISKEVFDVATANKTDWYMDADTASKYRVIDYII